MRKSVSRRRCESGWKNRNTPRRHGGHRREAKGEGGRRRGDCETASVQPRGFYPLSFILYPYSSPRGIAAAIAVNWGDATFPGNRSGRPVRRRRGRPGLPSGGCGRSPGTAIPSTRGSDRRRCRSPLAANRRRKSRWIRRNMISARWISAPRGSTTSSSRMSAPRRWCSLPARPPAAARSVRSITTSSCRASPSRSRCTGRRARWRTTIAKPCRSTPTIPAGPRSSWR